jgi:oxygen-independent coproporphyrinogen-3 oxidase
MSPVPLLQTPPLSVYVHLPWCVRKCPYCDFNSYAMDGALPEKRYVAALDRDLDMQAQRVRGRCVQSVFFGGGTPSLFSPAAIGEILGSIARRLTLDAHIEITLEANPGTVERGRFAEYRSAGINRVSLGAQSFNDRHLGLLGRIHSAAETRAAAEELHESRLTNFNLDLMYGLPQQTVSAALDDIAAAVALRPRHISHYQLTLEPGTVFYHRPPPLPHEDDIWQMQIECQEALAASGYEQYEISAYAQAGARCAHNLNYWQFGDYLGIGAGAHGKLTDASANAIGRTAHVRQPRQYLEAIEAGGARLERWTISPDDLPFEFMLNALRLLDGFHVAQFQARTGQPMESLQQTLEAARRRGMIEADGSSSICRPTEFGRRFLNDLQALFLPKSSPCVGPAGRPQVVNLL